MDMKRPELYSGGMLNNLQALRALAATLVVFVHVGAIKHLGLSRIFEFGHSGVDVFFLISGFVMVYSIWNKPVDAGRFALNRAIRIIPLYWGLTLALFATSLFGVLLMQPTWPKWVELAMSLAFIPYLKADGFIQPIYFLGWTLNMEMAFYLVFAICIAAGRGSLYLTTGLSIGVIIVAAVAGMIFHPTGVIFNFYTKPIILQFALGMVIAIAYIRNLIVPQPLAWAGLFISAAMLLFYPEIGIRHHNVGLLPATGLIVACALSLEQHGRMILNKFVLLIGGASYSLYLFHPFATATADRISTKVSASLTAPVAIVFSIAAAFALAILIHKAFELPATAILRKLTIPSAKPINGSASIATPG